MAARSDERDYPFDELGDDRDSSAAGWIVLRSETRWRSSSIPRPRLARDLGTFRPLTHGRIAKNPTPERSSTIEFGAIDHQADGAVRIGLHEPILHPPRGRASAPTTRCPVTSSL